MALTQSLSRFGLGTVERKAGIRPGPSNLASLSQRKLNAIGLPLAYVDGDRRYRFVNKAFLEWTGKVFVDVIGQEVQDVDGREAFPLYEAYVDAVLAGERTGFERQLTVAGRPAIWIHVDYYPDRGADGDVRGFLVCYANVDQLKRLELEAGGREHRLRLVTDSVGSPIIHFDRNLKLRFANKPFGDWVGVAPDDLLGRRVQELIAGGTFADMDEHIDRAFAGAKVSFERRERKATGELRWVRVTLFPDRAVAGRVDGIFAVMTDIDDDIAIRDALRAQEVQLRLFADNIPGPIAYLDRLSTYTFVNQAFANWVRLPQDQIYGRTPFEVLAPEVASFLRPVLERANGGEHVEYERLDSQPGGAQRWVHGRIAPDFDVDGRLRGLYCTEYDIDDLKRTEQALATREEQLRLFTDNIPDPVVYLDTDRRYTFVNDAFLQLNGLDRVSVIGKTTADVIGLEATTGLTPYQDRAFAGETVVYERALVDATGRSRWIRGRMVPDHRIDGAIQGIYVVLHDITDLKSAQDTLAARESQLRAVMDGVPAPVAYIDRTERCQYVNRALLQYFGFAAEEVATLRLADVIGPRVYEGAQAKIARALDGESAEFDRLIPGAHGVSRWMTVRVVPDATPSGDVPGAFVLMNDIHGLKQAQEALRASESELRLIMDNVPARVAYIDREYRYRFLNRHNEEWLGLKRNELTGRAVADVVGEERFAQMRPLLERVLLGETVSVEQLLAQPTGDERWESVHYAPNRDAEGVVIGIYAVHTDVHDQKRNEDALTRANWMLSSHINNTPLAVLEWDRDFRLVRWSPQAEDLFGWRAEEVLGMPIDGNPLLHDADRGAVAELLARLVNGEEPRTTGMTRNTRKGGQTIWCEWYHSCLVDDRGNIVSILSFVQDVSLRIEAEERLQHMATRDALTGLPNRLLLHERLAQAIAQAKRSGRRVGVLFIDLDRFKNVNDTLGHRIGDELLKSVSAALGAALRDTDLLARLGGDEFMVVVEDFDDPAMLGRVAQKLLDAVAHPFRIEESRHLRDIVDRHQRLSGRFGRPRGAAQARGCRDVSLEGARAQHLPVPRRRPGPAAAAPAHARKRAAQRAEGRAAAAALPADRAGRRQRHRRRRGAPALERRGARQRLAQGLHCARRGIGPDPRARRVGAADRGRAMRGVAPRGADADGVDQPFGTPVLSRRHRAADFGHRARDRLRAVVDRARSDGDESAARRRRDPQGAARAAQRWLHRRDRRFRHRLLVAHAPQALPDRHAEDRHLLHRRPRDRSGRRRDHRGHHRPRARPRAHGDRRGRGNAGAARFPRGPGLPLLPGLLGEPAASGRRVRPVPGSVAPGATAGRRGAVPGSACSCGVGEGNRQRRARLAAGR